MAGREFQPPQPEGEPFRADPADPPAFVTESEISVRPSPASLGDAPAPPVGAHPPSHNPEFQSSNRAATAPAQPQFRPQSTPRPRSVQNDDERFAKIGIGIGLASILLTPILGPVAIVMGSMAIKRGQKKLGAWALSMGIAGTVIGIVVAILVLTGVMPSFGEMLKDIGERQK